MGSSGQQCLPSRISALKEKSIGIHQCDHAKDEVKTCEIRIGKLRVEKYLGAEEPLVAHIDSEPALCDAVDSLILLDILVGVLVKPGNGELSLILGRYEC